MNRYSKGGLARAAALPAEQRSAIARKAAQARWAKPHTNVGKQMSAAIGCCESTYHHAMRHLNALQNMAEKFPALKPTIQRVLFEPRN